MTAERRNNIATILITLVAAVVVIPIVFVIAFVIIQGMGMISWEFITSAPTNGMREGGIGPALLGTILLTLGTAIVAMPLAIGAAIYLAEYAPNNWVTRQVRLAIVNLAGIPSIVYGLFGLGMFVLFLGTGTSILAGSLTLGLMTLPVVISTAEEAILSVPPEFRTVSLSLGATKWQTIRNHVLPHATPGIITGVILGLSRAAGETAPILFTVAAFYLPELPKSIMDQTMALPYHLYVISTQVPGMPTEIQYATALVLLLVVLLLTTFATIVRTIMRRRREW
ncbi:MAG: phosphate ABC transporter permease PstA [Anaerolineae bacterium]|nr:phosphate ABC transporter permease PstA [Anaerolineae bacterium]MCO5188284.1 phosphate ABC transporter permease PstA [Anaerolineae bacterium]MCO5195250.1 phosphate ABC transporter permease PstA [Anaerolineae bacterium]MCO5197881.1 phosphate ABC transporter permease PstA [Anaerolineae bacterium]MCO5203476.1 phosphate ABC transporter permease PstA [Anaerolineae bacterium]